MRLWHTALIKYLPGNYLKTQHMTCCSLRGVAWGRKHATVDYVFRHSYFDLYGYHMVVQNECRNRGYRLNPLWIDPCYRGRSIGMDYSFFTGELDENDTSVPVARPYAEHDDAYLCECLKNLSGKGVELVNGKCADVWLVELAARGVS